MRLQLSVSFPAEELERLTAAGKSITTGAVSGTVDAWNDGDPAGASVSPVTAPVLVLRGRDDPFITSAVLDAGVVPRFADVTTADVEGAGHWPHIERPDTVATLIDGLVGRVWRRSRATPPRGFAEQGWTSAFAERSPDRVHRHARPGRGAAGLGRCASRWRAATRSRR